MTSKRLDIDRPKLVESKINRILAQCCALIGPDLLMLSFGMSMGFPTILIPELLRKDAEIFVTTDELTWISSMSFFIVPVGALVSGPLIDRSKRKSVMFLSTGAFVLGWFQLYWWATNGWTVMLALAFLGFAGGVISSVGYVYASEICEVRYRGAVLTSPYVAVTLGVFLQILIGNYLYWRTCALVDGILCAVALVAIFLGPESPQWLTNQGRLPEAEQSLRWLRGWTDPAGVKLEYDSLVQSMTRRISEETTSSVGFSAQRYFRREVLLPFFMLVFAFFLGGFNGADSFMIYSVLVFEKLKSPIDKYDATIINGALQMLAPAILTLVIKRTGKRFSTLGSLFVSGLSLLGIAVYEYLRERSVIQEGSSHSWIPMTLVLLTVFVSCGGILCSPWIMAAEVFPVEVRGIAMGILSSSCNTFNGMSNKSFLYMLDSLTLPGTFLFYAVINFLGLVVLYCAMPETEGKTLDEIQQFYRKKRREEFDRSFYFTRNCTEQGINNSIEKEYTLSYCDSE